jgi:1,2-phenylacetyl-CoA epoxidase catalytic subunit
MPDRVGRMDPSRDAVVDLLGVLAYGELIGFERLAEDAHFAPTIPDKAALAALAADEFTHYRALAARLEELGVAPEAAMEPFTLAIDAFHVATEPSDWLEGLVKAYVGDGLANDFYAEIAEYVDASTRELVQRVVADTGHAEFVVERVRRAIAEQPAVAGRLALWARRIVGEALAQAHRVAAGRPSLTALLASGDNSLADIGRLFTRLTEAHARRMATLGMSA